MESKISFLLFEKGRESPRRAIERYYLLGMVVVSDVPGRAIKCIYPVSSIFCKQTGKPFVPIRFDEIEPTKHPDVIVRVFLYEL